MNPVVVTMGVSGSGKTTIGRALAGRLGLAFVDGDDLHPAANIAKMKRGEPLDDADRAPWLTAVAAWIVNRGEAGGVVSCSALKRAYRDRLRGPGVRFVYLEGAKELIAARMAGRKGHFYPPSLLQSQFDDLEPPTPDEQAIVVCIDQSVSEIVEEIVRALAAQTPAYHS
jgi:gluconokinase